MDVRNNLSVAVWLAGDRSEAVRGNIRRSQMPLYTVPGSWVEAQTIITFATNRTGATLDIGDVCAFDIAGTDGDVDVYTTTATDPFANVIEPTGGMQDGHIFCLAMEATANDKQGKFLVRGIHGCLVAPSNAVDIGDGLMTQASAIATKRTDGNAGIGFALEAGTAGGSATVIKVLFDGWAFNSSGGAFA